MRRSEMKRLIVILSAAALALAVIGVASASGSTNRNGFKASLIGYNEVPSISSPATGSLRLSVNEAATTITFTLKYSGVPGNAVTASHIHLGQAAANGGVIAFLCGGGSKPACPASPATVTGTIVASDILGPTTQGIAAGDFAAALRALRSGFTYVNVHTPAYPSGEIRGQIPAHGPKK
jgi:hypothetical protein